MLIAEQAMVLGSVGSATCCLASRSQKGVRARVLTTAMAVVMVLHALNGSVGFALFGATKLILFAVIAAVPYRNRILDGARLHRVLDGPVMTIVMLTPIGAVADAHGGHLALVPLRMLVCAYLGWTILMTTHRGAGVARLDRFESGTMFVSMVAMIAPHWTASH